MGGEPDYPIRTTGLGVGFGGGWSTRLAAALCLLLLLVYGALWSGLVQRTGGAESYVRQTPFLATLTGATIVAGPTPPQLYDLATQATAQGRVLGADVDAGSLVPYSELPFAAVALAPLVRLDASDSILFTVWALLTTTAAGLGIGLLAGRWPAAQSTPWLLMLAATSFLPLITALMRGQSTVLALLGWVGLSVGLKSRREFTAGIIAALVALQPAAWPALLGVLVLTRRVRPILAILATLLAGAATITPLLGLAWPLPYLRLLGRLAAPGAAVFPLANPGAWLPAGIAAGALLLVWRRPSRTWRPGTTTWDLRWALTLFGAVLLTSTVGGVPPVAAIVPAWIVATHLANGWVQGRPRTFWLLWLPLGYALGPVLALFPTAGAWAGTGWLLAALAGTVWALAEQGPEPHEAPVAHGEWTAPELGVSGS